MRGPARSSQPPNSAAEMPRNTMPISKVTTVEESGQLQVVVVSRSKKPRLLQAAESPPGMAFASGFQNTLNA